MVKLFYMLAFLLGTLGNLSAQMVMFKGSFDEALKKAKEEKKDLFVDFYADWCGPCKAMATRIFTLPEVGDYFNAHFVCVQVNVEAKENSEVAKKYDVKVLPTMVFINGESKELRRAQGAMEAAALLKEAKIARGEELSFIQMYEKFKKKKNDLDLHQQLLLDAPLFLPRQEEYDRQKWTTRIESLFPAYLKNKKLGNMINEKDFQILMLYHPQTSKEDEVFDFVVANYDKFVQVTKNKEVAGYLIALNNGYIVQLCKKGDLAYKDRLERVNKDLKPVYSEISFGSLSVLDAITLLADATYYLYRHDEAKFFENMDKYFAGKGDQVEAGDYGQALEDLSMAYNGQLSKNAYTKSIDWITKALEKKDMDAEMHTRFLIILAQCFQNTNNVEKAKQCLNQAFVVSAGISDQMQMQYTQRMIKQYMEGL
ncbi:MULTISPECIES: thioredoxin domain-containing protein [Butyricimonas]|uniref:thioredoxin domain-containing protein n=1 Tax=Butyricimonas TaxID=574697 RepID=UPI001D08FA8A|nr:MULTISPECIES: thioredoxin domain-containing protein [Butyricimonas]MCB6972198.1 thioredoxin fold domain-containing protein [Butyricimonas synergistica]MCG4519239.1 thioredoxin domain-containing protein [Butyricimonas sp. DFI.6.44]